MKILVDADACPVKDIIIQTAQKHHIPLIMVTDTAHMLSLPYGEAVTVDKQSDSADFAILNRLSEGDIAITQDYGLAAMALAKKAYVLNNSGQQYTPENIDSLLLQRHLNKKARMARQRSSHPKKRTSEDNRRFQERLEGLIRSLLAP